ncbi:MAG: DUF4258 domain-containing protein [Verrucomicrobia bacterium]|nr:DUF4258 domain-containing protein [Verrucomicrobiota bacterium]
MQKPKEDLQFTKHALARLEKRRLTKEMVEQILQNPERRQPDSVDPELEQIWGRVPALANRRLRVIVSKEPPRRVITAHLDRLAEKKA